MSDPKTTTKSFGPNPSQVNSHIKEVRYSLAEMMDEVRAERKQSALGREMVDSTEINKMFAGRKRKKKAE